MSRRGETGFALVGVLWFLALLALVAVLIDNWISDALDRAIGLQRQIASSAALMGATDRTIFLFANGAASPRGLELGTGTAVQASKSPEPGGHTPTTPFIALDGRPYRLGEVILRLQDEAGLYDLGRLSRESMGALLRGYGLSSAAAERMSAAVMSYREKQGARSADADYARAGLPQPRHAPLLTPWELYRVVGWSAQAALWDGHSPFADLLATAPTGGVNINTVLPQVLAALTGLDEQEATRLAAARFPHPITDLRDLPAKTRRLEDWGLQLTPSNSIRLTLTAANDPLSHIVSIDLTPGGIVPYRINFAVDLPGAAADFAAGTAAIPLPDPPGAGR